MFQLGKSEKAFNEAKRYMPGGVNSPVRSYRSVGSNPPFISSASGKPVRYDSDKETQLTMQGIALNVSTPLFAAKYPNGCPVRGVAVGTESKTVYWLTPEQVMQWIADLSMHIGTCKQAGWAKQAEVEACKTTEEVAAVTLEL